jgi:hypothetical protein
MKAYVPWSEIKSFILFDQATFAIRKLWYSLAEELQTYSNSYEWILIKQQMYYLPTGWDVRINNEGTIIASYFADKQQLTIEFHKFHDGKEFVYFK